MDADVFWAAIDWHQQQIDADRRHIGELVRGATLRMFNLQLKRTDRIKDPRKFWPMPWDDTEDEEQAETRRLQSLTDAERKDEVDKFFKRIGNYGIQQER